MTHHPKLTPLGELFEQATRTGIDEWGLADRLLKEIKAGLTAFGYRRQFTWGENGQRKERLPRDTHRQPIPHFMWQDFNSVSASLGSEWVDDPDEPEQSAHMDWVSGQFETTDLDMGTFEALQIHFHGIAIQTSKAKALLAELVGKPKKRRGAPSGPRNSWEREQAQKGFEMILAGDQRPHPEIALSLVHRDTPEREVGNQKRRILAGIRAHLADTENSKPE
ncbi:hypothetical protein [Erythrobacter tepidarius]|uniref:hypothetical protein n=1 Tax=Erythrobacter tepidarius TaxID=60454 RepID=UPI000A3725E6|nr:hypothetical protein [Erythrobacter tepidarius]